MDDFNGVLNEPAVVVIWNSHNVGFTNTAEKRLRMRQPYL
jgi:hypothetical protein